MPLTQNEQLVLEAINSLLQQDAKLGLAIHTNEFDSAERGYEYLHGQIDEMFAIKAADLVHAESVCQAFHKVHNYKYLDDPTFKTAMEKEMVAVAVPAEERKKALGFIPSIISELKEERRAWSEKDAGFNPRLDEIKSVSKPAQPGDFAIHDAGGFNKSNMTWDKGNASPSRTPSDS